MMNYNNLHVYDNMLEYESETGALHYYISNVTGGAYAGGYMLAVEKLVDVTDDGGNIIDSDVVQEKPRYYLSMADAVKEIERREWELTEE